MKIEIIGAGPGGLLAAYRLDQAKIGTLHISEARPRTGGRLLTSPNHCELGPWSLGDGGNPETIKRIALELGLETTITMQPWKRRFLDEDQFIDYKPIFDEAFGHDKTSIKERFKKALDSAITIQDAFDVFFKGQPLLHRYFSCIVSGYQGSPPQALSAKLYEEATTELVLGGLSEVYKDVEKGIPLLRVKGGNDLLVQKLTEKLAPKIDLNKELVGLERSADTLKIRLTFKDTTTREADIVILALPVSAYRRLIIKDALIPQDQLEAIKQVCPGTVSKILLPNGGKQIVGATLSDDFAGAMAVDEAYISIFWNKPLEMDSCKRQITQLAKKLDLPVPTTFIKVEDGKRDYPKDAVLIVDWPQTPYTYGSYSAYSPPLEDWVKIIAVDGIEMQNLFKPAGNIFFVNDAAPVHASAGCVGAAFECAEIVAQCIAERAKRCSY